jgi:membrane glycosyltransferase
MSLAENLPRPAALRDRAARATGVGARGVFFGLSAALTLGIVAVFAASLVEWPPAAFLALPLLALSAFWVSGGAATALLGLLAPQRPLAAPPAGWVPSGRTAILVTLCGEDARPLAGHLAALRAGLDAKGLGEGAEIFVLSDTSGAERIAAEAAALHDIVTGGAVRYRRRARNTGRKPGNIADWLAHHGEGFAYMMTLDADSRMSADRIRALIHRIETRPRTGLLQAGIGLVPGRSGFGRHQRISARLLSPGFGRGFAAWSGPSGNYWGHNAIMRVEAFHAAAALPVLPGRAPFGGPLLSHDFIEAAWIRRAGWAVELDPDPRGSAEDAPQTLAAFHRRDRRWCQGNLQHLRLLAAPGLDPLSRFHLVSGVMSYLAAPAWLILVILVASGAVSVTGAAPFAAVALVLVLSKLCALAGLWRRARTAGRRAVALRASAAELLVSSLIAPLVMVRQAGSVASVCMGRDCGWRPAEAARARLPRGAGEAAMGAGLAGLGIVAGGVSALWLAPVVLPLLGAPLILRALDAGAA